jgi:uncharacterized protein YprB with RNaseH-like and TPR domain
MSSLTDRLRGIVGGGAPPISPDARGRVEPLNDGRGGDSVTDRSAWRGLDDASLARAAAVLGGSVSASAAGATIVVDRDYPATSRHGTVTIGEIADVLLEGDEALAVLTACPSRDPSSGSEFASGQASGSRPESIWFLDLETTGLAGGAGTQAFLVGCACLSSDGFAVRQFLLPGYEHERALLAAVTGWAAARGAIVTFNGRSFDVPLIETRYLFHRQKFPLEGLPHVDMLHPARRLWRSRGEWAGSSDASCSLGTLEKLLAGVHRVGDVPGFEIPSRYFQFVRSGDARPLEAVLEHNRLDLVSLALVMARALTLVERGPAAAQSAYECLGLARIYDRAGRRDDAEAAYLQAIDRLGRVGRDPETLADALRRLAYCRRRAGRWREAAEAWQCLADLPRCPAAIAHEAREALAIYYEHRTGDLDVAHVHARQLMREPANLRQRDAAEHRLRRLERKLAKTTSGSSLWPEPDEFQLWSLKPEA